MESQVRLNTTVSAILTSKKGVVVMLADGTTLSADHALCTFSLGVLQHDDVRFIPPLPTWKQEAIHSTAMVSASKCSASNYQPKLTMRLVQTGHVRKGLHAVPGEVLVRYRGTPSKR